MLLLCLIVAVIPWTIVEGRKGCWAAGSPPGHVCIYDTILPGSHDLGIQYYFTSRFSRICCEVLMCEYSNCKFRFVGCGQSVNSIPIKTDPLPWVFRFVEPMMRCFDTRGVGVPYSYTVDVTPMET